MSTELVLAAFLIGVGLCIAGASTHAYQALAKSGPRLIVSNRPLAAASAMLADPAYARKLEVCGVKG